MRLLQQLLAVVFPITCESCGVDLRADDRVRICPRCRDSIRPIDGLACVKCGRPLPDGGARCFQCRQAAPSSYECIRSFTAYEGVIRDLLHRFKYQNRDYLDRFLGGLLADAITRHPALGDVDYIIAVPLHWTKKFVRGYNQAELLAARVAGTIGRPVMAGKFSRVRMTRAQYRLSRDERRGNMRGGFSFSGGRLLRGKKILLVDDICTTGATIEECARTLKKAGASVVYGLTVARD